MRYLKPYQRLWERCVKVVVYLLLGIELVATVACSGNNLDELQRRKAGGAKSDLLADLGITFALPVGQLRRLTQPEYNNSVRDLLGAEVVGEQTIAPDTIAPKQFSTAIAAKISMTVDAVHNYEKTAQSLAQARFATPALGEAFVGCTPSIAPTDACVAQWLSRFLPLLFRRPLAEGELSAYQNIYQVAGERSKDSWQAAQELLAIVLMSPKFLYRTDFGMPIGEQPARLLTGHEVATRLSFLLWQTTPSADLLAAAQGHELDTAAGIASWGKRLLADKRARPAVRAFFNEWLNFEQVATLGKKPDSYPTFSPALAQAMAQELGYVVQDIVFDKQSSVRELLTTSSTFLNPILAEHYGVPAALDQQFVPHTWDRASGRSGLLTMAGFLAAQSPSDRTSPTARGLFVRNQLLCQQLPDPPPNIPVLPGEMMVPEAKTMRQKLEEHRINPNCSACHQQMDPIGLGLEHFDTTGAFRALDNGQPLDTSGTLDGVAFQDGIGLGQAVAQHERFLACVAEQLYTYALGQKPANAQALAPMVQALEQQGEAFLPLVEALITSPAFRYVGEQP